MIIVINKFLFAVKKTKFLIIFLLFLFVFPVIGNAAEECKIFNGAAPLSDYCPDCYFENKNESGPSVCSDKWRYLVYDNEISVNQRCKELGYEYGTTLETYPYSEWCYFCNAGMKKYDVYKKKWNFLTSCKSNKTVKKAQCCRPVTTYDLSVSKIGSGSGNVVSNPSGINCGSGCLKNYENGTIVVLTATPNSDSVFANWAGGCSGNSPICELTINEDKSVEAVFDPLPLPIVNFQVSSSTIFYGSSVTLLWTTQNSSYCTASGDWEGNWTGSEMESGSYVIQLNTVKDYVFTLTCFNSVQDSSSETVYVQVLAKPPIVVTKPVIITL